MPAYFNPDDAKSLAPIVFMQAAPPPIDDAQTNQTYANGPITDSSSQNVSIQNCTKWSGRTWEVVWANRSVQNSAANPKANPIYPAIAYQNIPPLADPDVRTEYTTIQRADAATKAEVLYLLGASQAAWQAPLVSAGICAASPCSSSEAVAWSSLAADATQGDPQSYFKNNFSKDGQSYVLIDRMVIPQATLSTNTSTNSYGVVLDYEVQDYRTIGSAHGFLSKTGKIIADYGRKSYLYTNPWDGGELTPNGFSISTINDIESNFDYVGLYALSSFPDSSCHQFSNTYTSSINYLKGSSGTLPKGYGEIVIMVDLGLCSSQDALQMYNQQTIDHFAGYYFFADVTEGGQQPNVGANAVIYPLVYGSLPPGGS
ncbi:MAG: hypothetical protein ACR2F8_03415 [Caulobacteraceae bacterium]